MSRYPKLGLLLAVLFAAGCADELVDPQAEVRPQFFITGVTSMSVGNGEVCRTIDTGVVRCDGKTAVLTGTHSSTVGTFTQVSVSGSSQVACGLRNDGNAQCLGSSSTPINIGGWDGGGIWTRVSTGSDHLCFLSNTKRITCFGSNSFGQTSVEPGPYFKDVSAGMLYTCGVVDDAFGPDIMCWGNNDQGQAPASVAPSAGRFQKVKTGTYHTCGLTSTGAIDCFGRNNYGQAGSHPGPYIDMAIGTLSTCGLKSSGVVECWGANFEGEALASRTAQRSRFIAVDGRGATMCGLRADGHFECFSEIGSDDERTIPGATSMSVEIQSANRVYLSWMDKNSNEIRIEIERSAADGAGEPIGFSQIKRLPTDAVNFTDRTVTPGSYFYRIRFCNLGGCSAWQQTDLVIIPASLPAAPTNVVSTFVGVNQIDFGWTDNATNEDYHILERREHDGEWTSWEQQYGDEIGPDETSYSDDELVSKRRYQYRIKACNALGCSAYAASVVITTTAPPIPAAPTSVTAEAPVDEYGMRVLVNWGEEGEGEGEGGEGSGETSKIRRRVYTGTAWGPWVFMREHFGTSLTDEDVTPNTRYQYGVSKCNAGGCSAYTASNAVTTPL